MGPSSKRLKQVFLFVSSQSPILILKKVLACEFSQNGQFLLWGGRGNGGPSIQICRVPDFSRVQFIENEFSVSFS